MLDSRFVRIHRAYIVNADHVTGLAPTQLALGVLRLDISRKYKERVKAALANHIGIASIMRDEADAL